VAVVQTFLDRKLFAPDRREWKLRIFSAIKSGHDGGDSCEAQPTQAIAENGGEFLSEVIAKRAGGEKFRFATRFRSRRCTTRRLYTAKTRVLRSALARAVR
jgi:hypothetical protein